jgi:Putative 2OG-Fe(II) oxygenase
MIEKQEVQELFPTPLWVVDLKAADAAPFNARLKAEIEKIIAPRPKIPTGSNWQTPQDLHTRPAFADFVKLVEVAPPGSYHPTHNHPNNFLSGVYYVDVPSVGSCLALQDPRPAMIMPKPKQYTRLTVNAADVASKSGRIVLFPSWLRHNVPANDGDTDRISIAFNFMFTNFAETLSAPMWNPSAGKDK